MVVYFGKRIYGRVDENAGTFVATLFFQVYFLPIIPLSSHLILEMQSGAVTRSIPQGLHLRSVLAGYARVWGLPVVAGLLMAAYAAITDERDGLVALRAALLAIGALVCVVLAYVWVGRLSDEQRAQRLIYREVTGYPVDVALLGEARTAFAAKLRETIGERIKGLGATSYRTAGDPAEAWRSIVIDPSVNDTDLLDAALTLARVEWSLASRERRAALAETHRRIWARRRAVQAEIVRDAAAMAGAQRWLGAAIGAGSLLAACGLLGAAVHERSIQPRHEADAETELPGQQLTPQTVLSKGQAVYVVTRRAFGGRDLARPAYVVDTPGKDTVCIRDLKKIEDCVPRANILLR